jgi:hypothetical protein
LNGWWWNWKVMAPETVPKSPRLWSVARASVSFQPPEYQAQLMFLAVSWSPMVAPVCGGSVLAMAWFA